MDYTLKDIIDGMNLKLDCEIPDKLENYIVDYLIHNDKYTFMKHKKLCISLVEAWLNAHVIVDYDNESMEEYISDWCDDFCDNWFETQKDQENILDLIESITIK